MVVQILVNAVNKEHSDPIINARGCWKKGYPIVCKQQGWNWGSMQAPPLFSIVRIIDANDISDVQQYVTPWIRKTAYNILVHDPTQDFFKVKIFADPTTIGTNISGQVVTSQMQQLLTMWGAYEMTDDNGVIFQITAMQALNGTGYINFGINDDKVQFVQTSYDPTSGIHTISADYSVAIGLSQESISGVLNQAQCNLLSINDTTFTFQAIRNVMIEYLQNAVKRNFDMMIGRSQYYFPDNITDAGYYNMSLQELKNTIIDIRTI